MAKTTAKNLPRKAGPKAIGVTPLGNNVLIEPLETEQKTKTGIFIPDTVNKDKPDQGMVVAIGSGKRDKDGKLQKVSVAVGDTVVFSKYSPDELTIGGTKYYIVSEDHILAIIG